MQTELTDPMVITTREYLKINFAFHAGLPAATADLKLLLPTTTCSAQPYQLIKLSVSYSIAIK